MKPGELNSEAPDALLENKQEEISFKKRNEIVNKVHSTFEDYFNEIRDSMEVKDRIKMGNVLSSWSALRNSWAPGVTGEDIEKSANEKLEQYFKSEFGEGDKKEIPENKIQYLEKMKYILNKVLINQLK